MAEDCHGYTRGSVAEPVLWLRCWFRWQRTAMATRVEV